MTIEIYFHKDPQHAEPRGRIRVDPSCWLEKKGGIRDFRRLLRLCCESDELYGTQTMKVWCEVLQEMPWSIKQEAVQARVIEEQRHKSCLALEERRYKKHTVQEKQRHKNRMEHEEMRHRRCMERIAAREERRLRRVDALWEAVNRG